MPKDTDAHTNAGKIYLVVTPFFPTPASFRGPFVYDQVRAIERNSDYRVVVFVPTSTRNDKGYKYNGIRVNTFFVRSTPSYLFNGIFDRQNARSLVASVRATGIDVNDIAVIHCHTVNMMPGGIALKRLNPDIRLLVQHHCRDPFLILNGRLASWRPNLRYRAQRSARLLSAADLHVTISEVVDRNLHAFPGSAPTENYWPYLDRLKGLSQRHAAVIRDSYVLYNGVDTSIFNRDKSKKANDTLCIGCIANFIALKDHITLIRAIDIIVNHNGIRDISLRMIGTGPTRAICEEYIREHGLTDYIHFDNEVHHEHLRDFYNSLNLFVLPSVYEGFGCVCTEAAACGVPFMVCPGQGVTEYICPEDYGKWVFAPHDADGLAHRIINFKSQRTPQTLTHPYDIDRLIVPFLDKVRVL